MGMGAVAVAIACCVPAPLPLLEGALIAKGALVISWNGLAYTAAGELAAAEQRGTALAFQNTRQLRRSDRHPTSDQPGDRGS
jgi:hypothetical protein